MNPLDLYAFTHYLHYQNVYIRHFSNMANFSDYIKSIRARGRVYFTSHEAITELGISQNALNCGMYKLRKKGEIVSPAKNLNLIVPPEYQSIGSLPPEEVVPILMQQWGLDYYVCLLSAAMYHGASHQKPQEFQVITNKQLQPLQLGKVKIKFIYKKSLEGIQTQNIVVKSGHLKIATPETTAIDLLLYPKHSVGINHIATVLAEMVEMLNSKSLIDVIKNVNEMSAVQRLGYILEHFDRMNITRRDHLISVLKKYLENKKLQFVVLATELPTISCPKNNDWKIIENTTIESDL